MINYIKKITNKKLSLTNIQKNNLMHLGADKKSALKRI